MYEDKVIALRRVERTRQGQPATKQTVAYFGVVFSRNHAIAANYTTQGPFYIDACLKTCSPRYQVGPTSHSLQRPSSLPLIQTLSCSPNLFIMLHIFCRSGGTWPVSRLSAARKQGVCGFVFGGLRLKSQPHIYTFLNST